MLKKITLSASALLAATTLAIPASAADLPTIGASASTYATVQADGSMTLAHHKRGHRPRGHFQGRGNPHRTAYRYPEYTPRSGYGERATYETRAWQGEDGRYYCRRSDGTTGLLIGGAAGALLGRELTKNGDRTLGTILGAVGGALLGREIEKRAVRCR